MSSDKSKFYRIALKLLINTLQKFALEGLMSLEAILKQTGVIPLPL